MTEFSFSRRRRLMMPALSVAAALAGALLCAPAPVAAEDAANPNVIVDDSALDGSMGANGAGAEVLPAPAHQPVSRLVPAGQSALEAGTPPETPSDETFSAVPTTPIESTSLEGSEESSGDFTTNPAAGEAAAGEAAAGEAPPEEPATAAPANAESTAAGEGAPEAAPAQTAETTTPAAGSDTDSEQTAAKPPIDGMVRLTFEPESSLLTDAAKAQLGPLVQQLTTDYRLRVQVLAYAAGDDDASSHARGISLARALAMRNYLTAQGITVDRMDIKALGNAAQEEPADRVDLVPLAE
jgi:outer membrane protein OmpA-like peptidoglycan-associated protein